MRKIAFFLLFVFYVSISHAGLYMTSIIGTGSAQDKFRPYGVDLLSSWAMIDLRIRPINGLSSGMCFFWTDGIVPVDPQITFLGDNRNSLISPLLLLQLPSTLGVQISPSVLTVGDLVGDLLTSNHPGRWNSVQPSIGRSIKEISFGGEVWYTAPATVQPVVIQDPTDDFNRADQNPITGNWTTGLSGWGSNNLRILSLALGDASTSDAAAYWNANSFSNDQFSSIKFSVINTNDQPLGPCVRMDGTAKTAYCCNAAGGGSNENIIKFSAGTFTQLATQNVTNVATGDLLRCEVQGSNISWVLNGVTAFTTPDPDIISGNLGIALSDSSVAINFWQGGDLSSAPAYNLLRTTFR